MTNDKLRRRGQSWQNVEWRRVLTATIDLSERAHKAFAKLHAAAGASPPAAPTADEHSCARMTAPYTGDGTPAGGPFVVRPEYRGFA